MATSEILVREAGKNRKRELEEAQLHHRSAPRKNSHLRDMRDEPRHLFAFLQAAPSHGWIDPVRKYPAEGMKAWRLVAGLIGDRHADSMVTPSLEVTH